MDTCTHEKEAIEAYITTVSKKHSDMQVRECGLHIVPEMPLLGASPDGIVSCHCCGKGVIEVKCPFNTKMDFQIHHLKKLCVSKMEN